MKKVAKLALFAALAATGVTPTMATAPVRPTAITFNAAQVNSSLMTPSVSAPATAVSFAPTMRAGKKMVGKSRLFGAAISATLFEDLAAAIGALSTMLGPTLTQRLLNDLNQFHPVSP